jgi:hypothetical protein
MTFDGASQIITLSSTSTSASEIWSRWNDWISSDSNNAKWPLAMTQVGGDDLGGGLLIPPYIFLINGWRVRPMESNQLLVISGNLYVDGGGQPVVNTIGKYNVSVQYTVPVQAQGYSTTGGTSSGTSISAADVWNYTTRELTSASASSLTTDQNNKLMSLNNADLSGIPASVWSNVSRTLTEDVSLPTDIINKVNSLNNYDDTFLRSSLLDKASTTDIQAISTKLDSKPTLKDIELSSVLAKSSELTVIENIMAGIPALAEIRNEMINVQFGGLEITNNQMIIKDKLNATIAIFDLFDKHGLPTMSAVYKRTVV